MNLLKILLLWMLLPLSANSAIIDLGNITRDTGTGLDWLDVTATSGLSVNDVLAELGEGRLYEGWRYGTATEVDKLITNFGFIPVTPCNLGYTNCVANQPGDDPIIETIIRTLGDTYAQAFPNFDFGNGAGETFGYVLDDINNFSTYSIFILQDYEFIDNCQSARCPFLSDGPDNIFIGGSSNARTGSFLVQESPVPIPAAVYLFGSALLGLITIGRRKLV